MALSGNFVSFKSIIESVFRRIGYQTIDVNEAVEVIGETLRIMGVLPSFQDKVTNGLNGNPIPVEISDYRAQIPSDYITIKGVRKVNLVDDVDEDGNPTKRINTFSPMMQATDIFYNSTANQHKEQTPTVGIYDAYDIAVQYNVTLVGSSGTMNISEVGNLTRGLTFDTDLTTTATNFVTSFAADYALVGITVTSTDEVINFTETVGGSGAIVKPEITNLTGNLNATVERNDTVNGPVIVRGQDYQFIEEYQYTYKIDNGYIYTNFQTGYVEIAYTGFVLDDYGFPMVPDDQRFIEAIRWSLVEHIDYKKFRIGEISRDIYDISEQNRAWYIASAMSKAAVPSADEMKAIKNMMLRSIVKVNEDESYFKYSGMQEERYNHNSGFFNYRYFRKGL